MGRDPLRELFWAAFAFDAFLPAECAAGDGAAINQGISYINGPKT
jgi:hypothetical protein